MGRDTFHYTRLLKAPSNLASLTLHNVYTVQSFTGIKDRFMAFFPLDLAPFNAPDGCFKINKQLFVQCLEFSLLP